MSDSVSGMVSRETILLASNSASRKAMLSAAQIAFEAIPADVDERALEAEMADGEPAEIAQALAAAKAAAVSAAHPERLVLGSDSLVEVEGRRTPAKTRAVVEVGRRGGRRRRRRGARVARIQTNGGETDAVTDAD